VGRPGVRIWTRSGTEVVEGVLERIGMDTLVVAEESGSVVHVTLDAVVEAHLARA